MIKNKNGHFYGDGVLINVSEILKLSCKNLDAFLARYGGDEFCIVLPANSEVNAEEIISRVEMNILEWNRTHTERKPIGLSIGYSMWDAQTDGNYEALIARADQRMYEAKNAKKCI